MKIQTITENNENTGNCVAISPETIETELAQCEEMIRSGLATFIEVGNALLRIREEQLYRKAHRTFEEYCRQRWSFGRSHAHRLVHAAQATRELAPIGAIFHESQIRPLLRLDPKKRLEAWQEALKANPTPTEWQVKAAVRKVMGGNLRRNAAKPAVFSPEITVMPHPSGYNERCQAFFPLGLEETRDLIDRCDLPDLREALLRLRDDFERCERLLREGHRQIA